MQVQQLTSCMALLNFVNYILRHRGQSEVRIIYLIYLFYIKAADYVLSSMIGTPSRLAKADIPASWLQVSFSILLPYPKDSTNIAAAAKPLSQKVIKYIFLNFKLFSKSLRNLTDIMF